MLGYVSPLRQVCILQAKTLQGSFLDINMELPVS